MTVRTKEAALLQAVGRHAFWQGGTGSEWECDCIVSADFLQALVALAARAPKKDVEALIARLRDDGDA